MAVVTVNRAIPAGVSNWRPAPFAVHAFMRASYATNDARRTAMAAFLGQMDSLRYLIYHWSGAIWQEMDLAPTKSSTATIVFRGTAGNAQGLDEMISLVGGPPSYEGARAKSSLQSIRDSNAGHANTKIALVLHNIPNGMQPASWPTQADTGSRSWPPAAQWGAAPFGVLMNAIVARYPGLIGVVCYGQELKGVYTDAFRQAQFPAGSDGLSPSGNLVGTSLTAENLRDFVKGYNTMAKWMRANHPTIKLWAPHQAFYAYDSVGTNQTQIDRVLSGVADDFNAPAVTGDERIMNEIVARIARDPVTNVFTPSLLPDAFTIDVSVGNGYQPRWSAPSDANAFANQWQRLRLARETARIMQVKLVNATGFFVPIVVIESYHDVKIQTQTLNANEQGVLQAGISLEAAKGGEIEEEARWATQQSDLSAPQWKYVDQEDWYSPYDVINQVDMPAGQVYVYPAGYHTRDLANMLPPGIALVQSSADTAALRVIATAAKLYLLNSTNAAMSVTPVVDGVTLTSVSVPAYDHLVVTLPSSSPQVITAVGGIASAQAFGNAALAQGAINISAVGGIATAGAFGASVVLATNAISTTSISSAEALGVGSITLRGLVPVGIASQEAFGQAAFTVGGVSITSVGGIASADAFGTPSLGAQPIIEDEWDRVTVNGWGTAVQGGPWVMTGSASAYGTDGAVGWMDLTAGNQTRRGWVSTMPVQQDYDVRVTAKIDKEP